MEFLIRFIQQHESFRKPETEAIADLLGLQLRWVSYSEDVRSPNTGSRGRENPYSHQSPSYRE